MIVKKLITPSLTSLLLLSSVLSFASKNSSEDMLPSDCYKEELYDPEAKECYLPCEGLSEAACIALEDKVYGAFDDFFDSAFSGGTSFGSNKDFPKTRYSIVPDLSLKLLKQPRENVKPDGDQSRAKKVWFLTKELFPESFLKKHFSEFIVYYSGNDLGYVKQTDNPGKWILGINLNEYSMPVKKDFVHTLVHEIGHVVFLNQSQVNSYKYDDCFNYLIDEGCARTGSYINSFYQNFWRDIAKENKRTNEDEDKLYDFYEKYRARFVSDYAATNPIEDGAEVFTHFIFKGKPSGDSVINRKIRSLYKYPELRELRRHIRSAMTKAEFVK
ncbi:hypothetical protein EOPP23_00320 [Endozoicomonas sp. OPT23]|uniref:hypothetical protein n=1 Tax=Endozoicomonas sp. OPT23 TaxID=2072845 RepID=UPI001891B89F|nr:hypothetical protein [Endozoicomonas sp. OPT23]MRI31433.1 hypothetical protein [Endozoicomonas sp. OPT23]